MYIMYMEVHTYIYTYVDLHTNIQINYLPNTNTHLVHT